MRYSRAGLQLTERFEGCRLKAYKDDGGVWTIGYGHTRGVYPGMLCTLAQAEAWLLDDVAIAEAHVHRLVKVPLDQLEYDALVDFEFNTGALAGSTLLKLLNAGAYELAAAQFQRWDKCKGVELAGLLRRRLAERDAFQKDLPRVPVN